MPMFTVYGLTTVEKDEHTQYHRDHDTIGNNPFQRGYPKTLKSISPHTGKLVAIRIEVSYNTFLYGVKK